jgi:malonyl-CoA/methylmalonyl-CoA synthetase
VTHSLYSRFAESFRRFRDRVLIETDTRCWRYGDVDALTGRLARRLAELGLKPGDRLLAQTGKSPQALLLYLACIRAGAVYLPLNTDYTEAELRYFFADAEPALAVCRHADVELFTRLAGTVHTLDTLFERLPEGGAPAATRQADDVAAILYTSGTTGKPKGAMLTHRNLVANAETLVALWRFTPEDRLLHALPIFHVHGLFVAVHCALFAGATLIFLPRFDTTRVLQALPSASVMMGVPTHYLRLLASADFTRESVAGLRLLISGSAPLSADTFRAIERRTGLRVLERYGMSETGMLSSNPLTGERRPGSVGFPLPDVELRITDADSGRTVPAGDVGMVEVRGPNVFKGYWRKPDKTRAEFRSDGYFITGDMGRFDGDGYLHLVGRAKDLIISGGLNVYPAEVEAVLDDQPEIGEAAVIGVPHPDFGEAVVAVVQASATIDEQALQAALRTQLAGFKVPKRILMEEALPRNTMGKIQKNLLRERYADLFQTNDDNARSQ